MFQILVFIRSRLTSRLALAGSKAILLYLALVWYSSSAFLFFEIDAKPELGWLDALWWAIVTMATVGYGDLFPVTMGGRYLAGVPAIVLGIGFMGYILTSVAARLVESRSRRLQGMLDQDISNHVILFNFTRADEVADLVHELRNDPLTKRSPVCLVDETLAEIPAALHAMGVHFVKGSPTDEETLARACLTRATHAILLAKDRLDHHSDDRNLVTVMMIEKLAPSVVTIVEMIDKRKRGQFRLAGADDIVCLGEISAGLLTREISDPGVNAVIQDLVSNASGSEIYVVPVETAAGSSYKDLALKCLDENVSLLGVIRSGMPQLNCRPDLQITSEDKAILVGADRICTIRLRGHS